MATSLETQEIMIAFAIDNADNLESWGKYELDELEDTIAEMSEEDRASSTGKRIKNRIVELTPAHDQIKEARQTESPDPLDDEHEEKGALEAKSEPRSKPRIDEPKQKTPMIMTAIIIGVVVMLLLLYFL